MLSFLVTRTGDRNICLAVMAIIRNTSVLLCTAFIEEKAPVYASQMQIVYNLGVLSLQKRIILSIF